MRLATIWVDNQAHLAICEKTGLVRIADLNLAFQRQWPETMQQMLKTGQLTELNAWYRQEGSDALDKRRHLVLSVQPCVYAPLYRHPPKIWGIGLNYSAHAKDLSESAPHRHRPVS